MNDIAPINLYKALAGFQQEVPPILKDTIGYGYQYADLPGILLIINPLMAKHGLGFYQAVNDSRIYTVIFHSETGEIIASSTPIPQGVELKGMNDFQVLGSAITYIRRYALSTLLGLVTDKDTDASGEQVKPKAKYQKPSSKAESTFMNDLEPPEEEIILHQERIEAAHDLKELKTVWESLPPIIKDKLVKVKDDKKFSLT